MKHWKILFKVFSLSVALAGTLYSIYLINSQHSVDFLNSLGFGDTRKTFNWCPNRLQKLEGLVTAWSLEGDSRQWLISKNGESAQIVDSLAIEKWLAKYCSLAVVPLKSEKILDLKFSPLWRAHFNDGSTALVYIQRPDIFQINELTFQSNELQQALLELHSLLKVP